MNRFETISDCKNLELTLSTKNVFYTKNISGRVFKDKKLIENTEKNTLNIRISIQKMAELLVRRQVCVADICCLDKQSKDCLKSLCLKTCLRNLPRT